MANGHFCQSQNAPNFAKQVSKFLSIRKNPLCTFLKRDKNFMRDDGKNFVRKIFTIVSQIFCVAKIAIFREIENPRKRANFHHFGGNLHFRNFSIFENFKKSPSFRIKISKIFPKKKFSKNEKLAKTLRKIENFSSLLMRKSQFCDFRLNYQ